jgi:endonuclease-8
MCHALQVPEGDSLHRAAAELHPVLVGKAVAGLTLTRRTESTDAVIGCTVTSTEARGKNLLVHLDNGFSLHVHLKMWGRIFVSPLSEARRSAGPNTVLVLDTDAHRVVISDAPVARLIRTEDLRRDFHFRHLGPDLLSPSFDLEEALIRLTRRAELPLGEAVMDQSAVAGIGNVWKSELCFNLKLDPFACVALHSEAELRALLLMAREQMQKSVEQRPRKLPDPFTPRGRGRAPRLEPRLGQGKTSVYDRLGKACYDCGSAIEMRRQGETLRSTYYCPRCQPARSA